LLTRKKSKTPILGIDLLGEDICSHEYILETLQYFYKSIDVSFDLIVFAKQNTISYLEKEVKLFTGSGGRQCALFAVNEVIRVHDDPLHAVRRKKQSSLCLGIRLLKEKKIDAFISTGNTGALITSAKMHLPMLEGLSKAALIALLPTKGGLVAVVDVGANVYCTPQQLVQFAQMGVAYQKSLGIRNPSVGLLNIGTEEKKGRKEFTEAYTLLRNFPSFVGNVEGREVFSGNVHVLVTDGFTGNIFLKTSEGMTSFILEIMSSSSKLLVKEIKKTLYPVECFGAVLCGMDGIIMKCHGNAHPKMLTYSLQRAIHLIQNSFLEKLKCNYSRG